MSQPVTITAAVITLNERSNLPAWLASVAWADEMVVVDGGSTDGTAEFAAAAGARVFTRRFEGFAAERNKAIELATSDWVLFVDADEQPTPALAAEIRRTIQNCRQSAFHVPIRSSILGRRFRFSGTQDDRPVRLVRRVGSCWAPWNGRTHEVLQARGTTGNLRCWMDHTTMPDVPTVLAKINRYTSLSAAARVAAGREPVWHEPWLGPAREVFRRLLWKHGWLDGPEGWTFCFLSGLSEWVLANKHRRLWQSKAAAS